ncbi:MAG: hypothetical protein ACJKSS_01000 [Patescibacteria group bacterium UBA2103]
MKIGLDWSGVIANVHEARRLVLMEMHGAFEDGEKPKGSYRGNINIRPFSDEYRKMMSMIYFGRAPIFTFTKVWALADKSTREEGSLLSITEEDYEAMKVVLYERPEYALNIPAIDGALDAIRTLSEEGHDVEIVTSRGPDGIPRKVVADWLLANMVDLPVRYGVKDKTQVLHEYDFFVDDKKRQLAPEDLSLNTIRILFAHHYNMEDTEAFVSGPRGRVGYCVDWSSILRMVRNAA